MDMNANEATETQIREAMIEPATAERQSVEAQLLGLYNQNALLEESLHNVQMMIDSRGWNRASEYTESGLSLAQVVDSCTILQELVAANPLIKRGSQLRISYAWSKGMSIGRSSGEKLSSALERRIAHPRNQRYLFDTEAHEELERGAFTAGNIFLLGDNRSRTIDQRIPIYEITDALANPDDASDVWAYRRQWNRGTEDNPSPRVRWYYSDTFMGTKRQTITYNGARESFDNSKTVLDKAFNRQIGWRWGVPDALAVIGFNEKYRNFLVDGATVAEAMTRIIYKATNKSSTGAQNTAVRVAGSGGAGNTASLVDGMDISMMANAGKGYDFDSGRPMAAMVATALEVSVVHLLSDPGASGSSYGSASNLDLPTKRAIVSRQRTWGSYFTRVLKWMGAPSDITVSFPELDDPELSRDVTAKATVWGTGLFHVDEMRSSLAEAAGVQLAHNSAPDGVLLPNNAESLARRDIDTDGVNNPGNGNGFANSQGSSAGVGPTVDSNDLRTDLISD